MRGKSLLIIGMLALYIPLSFGQMRNPFHITTEGYVDFDIKYGSLTNNYSLVNMESAYKSPVNELNGKFNFTTSRSLGFEGKVGYFLNDKKTWGITVGLMYLYQTGKIKLDTFHIEYSSVDSRSRTFRQLVSAHPISETLGANNINVPFMLHYQKKYSSTLFYSVDAGILYNIDMSYNYTATGSFDYEAIYKYDATKKAFVYDNSPVVTGNGVIPITAAQYYSLNPNGKDVTGYINELSQKWGANVGLNQPITAKSGSVNYKNGNIGFMAEPCVNYQINDNLFLKFGIYYIYQSFTNNGNANQLPITSKIGDYNGLLNETKSFTSSSFGITVGLKLLLKDKIEESINYVSPY